MTLMWLLLFVALAIQLNSFCPKSKEANTRYLPLQRRILVWAKGVPKLNKVTVSHWHQSHFCRWTGLQLSIRLPLRKRLSRSLTARLNGASPRRNMAMSEGSPISAQYQRGILVRLYLRGFDEFNSEKATANVFPGRL